MDEVFKASSDIPLLARLYARLSTHLCRYEPAHPRILEFFLAIINLMYVPSPSRLTCSRELWTEALNRERGEY